MSYHFTSYVTIHALISLRLGFRRNFLSVSSSTDRKFLRNPNLNEIIRAYSKQGHVNRLNSSVLYFNCGWFLQNNFIEIRLLRKKLCALYLQPNLNGKRFFYFRFELDNVSLYQSLPALGLTQSVHAKIYASECTGVRF